MAKKYFWLKLKDNFFTDKRIKKLRRVAGGDTYTLIYLKMQLLSLRNEGKLYFEGVEESFAEELALELDESVDNVNFTIMFLKDCGLLEEMQENEFALIETMNSIGTESDSAERVRKHRENKKALQCNNQVTIGNTEIEIEKEKEKDIDIIVSTLKKTEGVPKFIKISDARKKNINARVSEYGLEKVIEVIKSISQCKFLVDSANEKANFYDVGWIFKPDNFLKIAEGKYLTNPSQNNGYGQNVWNGNTNISEQTRAAGAPSNIYQGFEMWTEE